MLVALNGCAVTFRVVVEVTPLPFVVLVGVVEEVVILLLPGLLRLLGDGIRDEYRTYSFMVGL